MIKKYKLYTRLHCLVKEFNTLKQAMEYKARHRVDGYIVDRNVKNYQPND